MVRLLLFLLLTQPCLAQFKLTQLDKSAIPRKIQYGGNIIQAVRWADNSGDNIVILSKEIKPEDTDGSDGNLYAYHFIVSGDSIKQTWRIYDHLKDCPVDMFLFFLDKSFAITDLNNDGFAEIWVMYKVSCQGDVSPVPMKIIMYQNGKKYAARGTTKVPISENRYDGGNFSFDESFKSAPVEFRQYAEKLWKQHELETWQQ